MTIIKHLTIRICFLCIVFGIIYKPYIKFTEYSVSACAVLNFLFKVNGFCTCVLLNKKMRPESPCAVGVIVLIVFIVGFAVEKL